MTWLKPPLAVIASSADWEFTFLTVNFLVNSVTKNLNTRFFSFFTTPASMRTTELLLHHLQIFNWSRLTIAYSLRFTFKKPRFGTRRNKWSLSTKTKTNTATATCFLDLFDRDQKFYRYLTKCTMNTVMNFTWMVAGCNSWSFIIFPLCKC